jgi:hypothetical protein
MDGGMDGRTDGWWMPSSPFPLTFNRTDAGGGEQQPAQQAASSTIQTIVPLFKLTKGCASSSDGFSCAVLAGLATPVVQRAE